MREKGQSLIEVMVALGVAVIIITAIVMSVVLAIANSQFSKNQNRATYYAQQGIEVIRKISRSDWSTLSSYSAIFYCLGEDASEPIAKGADCGQNLGNFKREIEIRLPLDPENSCDLAKTPGVYGIEATVIVYWNDSKCDPIDNEVNYCHQVRLDSCFQNINSAPTP